MPPTKALPANRRAEPLSLARCANVIVTAVDETTEKRCLDRATPGVIYMFHLSVKADLDALPWIIQGLRDNGYTLVRLDTWVP